MEQLTYIQAMYAESAAPGVYIPIQSVALGGAIPLQLVVSVPPGAILVGLAFMVRVGVVVTVKLLLVAMIE